MNSNKKRRKEWIIIPIVWVVAIAIIILIISLNSSNKNLSYSELIQNIKDNKAVSVRIDATDSKATVVLKDDKSKQYLVEIPDIEAFTMYVQDAIKSGNTVKVEVQNSSSGQWVGSLFTILFNLFLIIIIIRFMKRMSLNGIDNESQDLEAVKSTVTFADVAGIDSERAELEEFVDFLKDPQKYTKMGASIPKGVLLSGDPGVGKTLIAKAIANEAGVPFFYKNGAEFEQVYVGLGAHRVRQLFSNAKKSAPCIIFIDEIDAVGGKRDDLRNYSQQTLNQILSLMDGINENTGIIIMAATNRPDSLDEALLRPGRFDRKVVVPKPDLNGREAILKVHALNKNFSEDVDFRDLARNTTGFSGAELANILNESAIRASSCNHTMITKDDVDYAFRKICIGISHSGDKDNKTRKLTAYHEAGHTICNFYLNIPIREVSIISAGYAGGYTWNDVKEEEFTTSKGEMMNKLISLFGGQMAEKLIFGDISTGASSDLEQASKIAYSMVTKYGMSDDTIASLSFDTPSFNSIIEKEAYNEVNKLLKQAQKEAHELLVNHEQALEIIAKSLLDNECISGKKVTELLESSDDNSKLNNIKNKV